MRSHSWIVLLAVAMIGFQNPVIVQTATPTSQPTTSPLIKMLALIPDNADTRPQSGLGISYADYRALEATLGLAKPSGNWNDDAKNLYFHAMLRLNAGINLSYFQRYVQDSAQVVGFDWSAVDQSIQIGNPPRTALLLAGTFDSTAIGKILKARNFEQTTIDGTTVWRRFDDAQLNIDAVEPADPFGGELGIAARIALLPGYIANSRFTDISTQFIATYHHKQHSLAQADDYRVLTAAITDQKTYSGWLIQALFVTSGIFEQSAPPRGSKVDTSTYGNLPTYSLGALADRQEGNTQVHLIALYYPDVETAHKASLELGKRIVGFDINQMYEQLNVTLDDPRVYRDGTGKAVAVISVHYDLPSATPDPNGSPVPAAGLIYHRWLSLIFGRQFTPLMTR